MGVLYSFLVSCLAWGNPAPESTTSMVGLPASLVGLKSMGACQNYCYQCFCSQGEPLLTHTCAGDPTNTHKYVWLSLLWGYCSFPLGSSGHMVWLCPPRVESLFPQSYRCSATKSHWHSSPKSLGIPNLFAESPGWKSWHGNQNLTTVGDILWYYCSSMCGLPTQWVWSWISLWLWPSYHFFIISPLSLDVGCLFGGFQYPFADSYLTASCNFGALAGRDECMFFSAYLNHLHS